MIVSGRIQTHEWKVQGNIFRNEWRENFPKAHKKHQLT